MSWNGTRTKANTLLQTKWTGISKRQVAFFTTIHFWSTNTTQGENVSKIKPVRHSFYRLLRKDLKSGFSDGLYQSPSSDPPRRLDEGVKRLCSVKCAYSIPLDSPILKDNTSADGKRTTKRLDYVLEMVPSGAAMEFNFYIGDEKQGSQNVNIEYQ